MSGDKFSAKEVAYNGISPIEKFLIDNNYDAVLILNKEGIVQYANSKAYNIFKYCSTDQKLNIYEIFPQLAAATLSNIVLDTRVDFTFVFGKKQFVEVNFTGGFGINGELSCLILRIEEQSQSKNENDTSMYQMLADHSTDMISRHNPDGVCTYVSPSCERILGYIPEQIIGHKNFDFIYEDDISIAWDVYPEILSKPIVKTSTYRVKHKDGRLLWFESTCHAIKDPSGELIGIYATSRDISERKQFEKELIEAREKAIESDRLKTAFVHNVSHEIRTPINAIIGFSDLLTEQNINPDKVRYYSEIINTRSRDLLEIINEILDIAKIESGEVKLNNENIKLVDLMDDLSSLFSGYQLKLKKSHIIFNNWLHKDIQDLTINTDPIRLKQILINLISNAFKFTEAGTIKVGVYLDNGQLVFFVEDTGIGIPDNKHKYIFERFAQIYNPEIAKDGSGTGLGLPIVKGLVELLGGKVWVESKLGKGSTFFFTIKSNRLI